MGAEQTMTLTLAGKFSFTASLALSDKSEISNLFASDNKWKRRSMRITRAWLQLSSDGGVGDG